MAAGQGQVIEKADYDTIKAKVDLVFGTGSGQTGYGQTITSATPVSGAIIYAQNWIDLRNDMVKCRQHQTGASVGTGSATDGANLLLPAGGAQITEQLRNQFDLFANTITSNRFDIGSAQYSSEGLVTGTRTTPWNGVLTHTVTISSTADNMRYFFNAGGKIRISANRSGGSASSKNATWDTMFSQMGEFVMDYTSTTYTGSSANGSSIGWFDLNTTDTLIGQKNAPSGSYADNVYYLYARRDAGLTQLILTIQFADLDQGLRYPDGSPRSNDGTRIDENVDGTLNSVVSQYRPSGANVSVTGPTATQSVL
jgi:hypothetical protein